MTLERGKSNFSVPVFNVGPAVVDDSFVGIGDEIAVGGLRRSFVDAGQFCAVALELAG